MSAWSLGAEFYTLTYISLQEKVLKSSQQRVEEEFGLINKEKLQKMNKLDVVIAFRLHQVKLQVCR